MKKINPTKPGKTQQNRHRIVICGEIYDWCGVSYDCGQLELSLFEKLV